MGDLNLDLLRYNHHVPTQEFIDSLFSYAFLLLISNPTRLTTYSARLIDNIFTNNLAHNVLCGMILNDLSDHLPVFAYFDDATVNAQHRKENYDDISMTIICINSTRTSVNRKDRIYKRFVTSPSTSSETNYKAYNNKPTHLIRTNTTPILRMPEMSLKQLENC